MKTKTKTPITVHFKSVDPFDGIIFTEDYDVYNEEHVRHYAIRCINNAIRTQKVLKESPNYRKIKKDTPLFISLSHDGKSEIIMYYIKRHFFVRRFRDITQSTYYDWTFAEIKRIIKKGHLGGNTKKLEFSVSFPEGLGAGGGLNLWEIFLGGVVEVLCTELYAFAKKQAKSIMRKVKKRKKK